MVTLWPLDAWFFLLGVGLNFFRRPDYENFDLGHFLDFYQSWDFQDFPYILLSDLEV